MPPSSGPAGTGPGGEGGRGGEEPEPWGRPPTELSLAPPEDLHDRPLPIAEYGGPWMRLHPRQYEPLHFGRSGGGRFDDPLGLYGVLYLAEDEFGAFVESFGRSPDTNIVALEEIRVRLLCRISACHQLRLVDLTGPGARRLGATGELSTAEHEMSQRWSRALHDHPECPDGFRYRLKHDLSKVGAAVFDRVEAATFTRDDLGSLADFGSERLLGKILDEYAFELS